jgi:serine/threonine-protein kinase
MATVFVGSDADHPGQLVAIKVTHPHLLEIAEVRAMLETEAVVAMKLRHPNVVAVRDVMRTADKFSLVMDYVEGASLAELNVASKEPRVEPLGISTTLGILIEAGIGLAAAHDLRDESGRLLDLVHRDVSPQNILVGLDGTTCLTDFGLAKVLATSAHSTLSLRGKVGYMAPEYIRDGDLSKLSDVFALGVVAWEALAGERLFWVGTDHGTLQAIVQDEPRRLSAVSPALAPFDPVLARALAKKPGQRWTSAAFFASALASAAEEAGLRVADRSEIAHEVERLVGEPLRRRRREIEGLLAARREVTQDYAPFPTALVTATSGQETSPTVRVAGVPRDTPPSVTDPSRPRARWHRLLAALLITLVTAGLIALYVAVGR